VQRGKIEAGGREERWRWGGRCWNGRRGRGGVGGDVKGVGGKEGRGGRRRR